MTSSTPVSLELDERVVLSAAGLLALGAFPQEMLLDFLWLLFSRASSVDNVDGAVNFELNCADSRSTS
jgi:hypothetical protein